MKKSKFKSLAKNAAAVAAAATAFLDLFDLWLGSLIDDGVFF